MSRIGKLTHWKSVDCPACGVGAGEFCQGGHGRGRHTVRTYVHGARKAKYNFGGEAVKSEKPVSKILSTPITGTITSFSKDLPGIFLTASEVLKNPAIVKMSLTTLDGQTIEAENDGGETLIRISQ